jgi:sterol desaturase/sphingolipid hydroxylase (fatty acid hydroxylase superfamily)
METTIRLGSFAAIFILVAAWEITAHKRALSQSRGRRWAANLGILLVNIAVQRLTIGALAFTAAIYAEKQGWGLFHVLPWPSVVEGLIAFLILDFAIYLQHVLSHALPAFWRLHQVHHADLDVDVTTGLRFHPVEILISMLYKAAIVLALGIDPWVVLIYEVALNGAAMFTHANVRLPERTERALRWVICTPDMHRVHHSIDRVETNSNFGNFLSVWDRLGGTMRKAPKLGQEGAILGLDYLREPARLGFWSLIIMPFRRGIGDYSFENNESKADPPPRSGAGQG